MTTFGIVSESGPLMIRSCAVLKDSHLAIFSSRPSAEMTPLNLHLAPCPKPMILNGGLGAAIVAIHERLSVSELRRHRLHINLPL